MQQSISRSSTARRKSGLVPKPRNTPATSCSRDEFTSLPRAISKTHYPAVCPCPESEKWDCSKLWTSKIRAESHVKSHWLLFHCPEAKKWKCDRSFPTGANARKHLQAHCWPGDGGMWPCPEADRWQCYETFSKESMAQRHRGAHYPLGEIAKSQSVMILSCQRCFNKGLVCNINSTKAECSGCLSRKIGMRPDSSEKYMCATRGTITIDQAQPEEVFLHSEIVCSRCRQSRHPSHFKPTGDEKILGHLGMHAVCAACRPMASKTELYKLTWVKWRSYLKTSQFLCTVPACVNTVSGLSISRQTWCYAWHTTKPEGIWT